MPHNEVKDVLDELKSRIVEKAEAEERLRRANASFTEIFPIQQSFQAGFFELDQPIQELVQRAFADISTVISAF
jgi:hypothetical protein